MNIRAVADAPNPPERQEPTAPFRFPEIVRDKPANALFLKPLFEGFPDGAGFREIRQKAFAAALRRGLPQPKWERWKYTNPANILGTMALRPVSGEEEGEGRITEDMLEWQAPGAEKYGDMVLWDLNAAFTRGGRVIEAGEGRQEDGPHVIRRAPNGGDFTNPRDLIRVAPGAQATVIEYLDDKPGGGLWMNRALRIELGEGASLRHYRMTGGRSGTVLTENIHVSQAARSSYTAVDLAAGCGFHRIQYHAELEGPEAECRLYGVKMLSAGGHGDTTVTLEHQAPGCMSDQKMRAVITDKAHGVFQGKVHVHPEGQKTDGYQLCNAMLLSSEAQMSTRPELEIYADDVRCSHGATAGALEEEPLFYLRSRGLSLREARALMIRAFIGEILDEVQEERIHEDMIARAEEWLTRS